MLTASFRRWDIALYFIRNTTRGTDTGRHVNNIMLSFLIYWCVPLFLFTAFSTMSVYLLYSVWTQTRMSRAGRMILWGKNEVLGEKPVPVPFFQLKSLQFLLLLLLPLFLLCLLLPLHLLLLLPLPLIILSLPFFFQFLFFFYHSFIFFHSFLLLHLLLLFLLLLYGATSQKDAVSFYTPKRNLWTVDRTIAWLLPTNYNTNTE